jgi:hypothetical protein
MSRRSMVTIEGAGPYLLAPSTRVCANVQGGAVKLFDGVPVVESLPIWSQLCLPRSSKVSEVKRYLEDCVRHDAEGRGALAESALVQIRTSYWVWFKESGSWRPEDTIQIRNVLGTRAETENSSVNYRLDLDKGRGAILRIYPDFSNEEQ